MFTVESSYCFLVWILTGLWEPLASILGDRRVDVSLWTMTGILCDNLSLANEKSSSRHLCFCSLFKANSQITYIHTRFKNRQINIPP